jgi:hypothetical protein
LTARICAQGFRPCFNTGPANFARRLSSMAVSQMSLLRGCQTALVVARVSTRQVERASFSSILEKVGDGS